MNKSSILLALFLGACGGGDDGQPGPAGPQGAIGEQGVAGEQGTTVYLPMPAQCSSPDPQPDHGKDKTCH